MLQSCKILCFPLLLVLAAFSGPPEGKPRSRPLIAIVGPAFEEGTKSQDGRATSSDAIYYRCTRGNLKLLQPGFYCIVERQWPAHVPFRIVGPGPKYAKEVASTIALVKEAVGSELTDSDEPDILIVSSNRDDISQDRQFHPQASLFVAEQTKVDHSLLSKLDRMSSTTFGCVGVPADRAIADRSILLIDPFFYDSDRGCLQSAFWDYFGISKPFQPQITNTFMQPIGPINASAACRGEVVNFDKRNVMPRLKADPDLLWRRSGSPVLDERYSGMPWQSFCMPGGATF